MELGVLVKYRYRGGKKENGLSNSSGVKLANALGVRLFTPRNLPESYEEILINYAGKAVNTKNAFVLNHPKMVKESSNKLSFFNTMKECDLSNYIPKFTSVKEEAELWINDGYKVVCRTLLNSSCGKGIVIARTVDELVPARLYVRYFAKKLEFRVHVSGIKLICIQQKKRLSSEELSNRGITERNTLIRNLNNGYIFSHNLSPDLNDDCIEQMIEIAIKSVFSFGLNFGAVDIVMNKNGEFKVLEINSCPGLEGTTLDKYKEHFSKEFNLNN